MARCHAHIVTDPAGRPIWNAHAPVAGFTPGDLRDAYKVTATGVSSTIIAIVAAYGYDSADSDLAIYRSFFGLPPCTKENGCFHKFNQRGEESGYPAQNLDWAQDSAIDLEMASAMCPGCTLYLVEADVNSFANLSAAENTAAALGAHVISNSYGGDEPNTQRFESSYHHAGVAVVASSGDRGYIVQFPASSTYVVAVGGTHLSHSGNKRGWMESAWRDGGSGCSAIYAKPPFQHDTGCPKRTVADVAAIADPFTRRCHLRSHPRWRIGMARIRRHKRRSADHRGHLRGERRQGARQPRSVSPQKIAVRREDRQQRHMRSGLPVYGRQGL